MALIQKYKMDIAQRPMGSIQIPLKELYAQINIFKLNLEMCHRKSRKAFHSNDNFR